MFAWLKKINGTRWSIHYLYQERLAYELHDESVMRLLQTVAACYECATEGPAWKILLRQNIAENTYALSRASFYEDSASAEAFIRAGQTTAAAKRDLPTSPEPVFIDSRSGHRIQLRSRTRNYSQPKRLEEYMISNPANAFQLFEEDGKDDFLDIMGDIFNRPNWRLRYEQVDDLPTLPDYRN